MAAGCGWCGCSAARRSCWARIGLVRGLNGVTAATRPNGTWLRLAACTGSGSDDHDRSATQHRPHVRLQVPDGNAPTYTDRLRAALLLATATHDPDAAVRFRSRLVELWLTDAGVIPARVESPYGLAEVLEWIAAAEAAVMTR